MIPAFAEENVLQTIEIEPVKDTYNIVLVSDKAVDVKKTIQESNKINLYLKDIRISKTLNTVYNNVSNVDTVMVEPQGNGINIFFQADNAQAATVTFDALTTAALPPVKKQNIKLNNPIESYAPIYKEDYQNEKTTPLFNKIKESKAADSIKESIDEDAIAATLNKTFSYGLVGLLIFAFLRLFRRRQPDMKIGLSQSLNEREINMYKNMQPQINNMNVEKPFTTVNYGINAYQKENRNPYESTPMTIHNPRLRNYTNTIPQQVQAQSQPLHMNTTAQSATQTIAKAPVQSATKPKAKEMAVTSPISQNNSNIDNLKFLESMTAIYEKSGRHDLARGLKESLAKGNIK